MSTKKDKPITLEPIKRPSDLAEKTAIIRREIEANPVTAYCGAHGKLKAGMPKRQVEGIAVHLGLGAEEGAKLAAQVNVTLGRIDKTKGLADSGTSSVRGWRSGTMARVQRDTPMGHLLGVMIDETIALAYKQVTEGKEPTAIDWVSKDGTTARSYELSRALLRKFGVAVPKGTDAEGVRALLAETVKGVHATARAEAKAKAKVA